MLYLHHRLRPFPTYKNCYSVFSTYHSFTSPCNNNDNSSHLPSLLQGHISRSHLLQIHARIFRLEAHQDNLIATRLIGQYPSRFAVRVFNQVQNPNIFPFNSIIRVLSEEGLIFSSFSVFKTLIRRSISPNDFTFSFLLKACLRSKNDVYAKQVHTLMMKLGWVCDSFVCNGLLVVYVKGVKDLVSALKVFDEMPHKGMVCCWTSLIAGYAQSGRVEEVLNLFCMMIEENLRPEDDTIVSVLSACSNLDMVQVEKWVNILSKFIVERSDDFISNHVSIVLVYLYGKLGKIDTSREIFDEIVVNGERGVLPWNAMINAYIQNGFPLDAIATFRAMVKDTGIRPNHVTMVGVLSGCAEVGDLDLGKWVHEYIKLKGSKGILETNIILATALIDMYAKCGSLQKAKDVFYRMGSTNVVSYNAMIMGHALNGEGEEALGLFSKMQETGFHPNASTFLGVLCACSHSGLLKEGKNIFMEMQTRFCITPKLEHYSCYIDLLARYGFVEQALEVVSAMPFEPNNFVWGSLLSGCLLHSKVELAKELSRRLVEVDPDNSGGYVMLSNALAVDQQWSDVSGLRGLMRGKRLKKQPGHSCISVIGIVHEFIAGSPSHLQIEDIYYQLDTLVKVMKV